jgi:hypothetical protein
MNRLIKEEKTETPEEFATRLGVSSSHRYRCIDEIKELGAPINFSRSRKTYYCEIDFEMKVSYSIQLITEQTAKKVIGGISLKNASLLFFESERTELYT